MGKARANEEKASTGGGTYPMATDKEALASLSRAKKELTPEEYAKLLAKVCKKYPDLKVCEAARNASMNDTIRQGFGRPPAAATTK